MKQKQFVLTIPELSIDLQPMVDMGLKITNSYSHFTSFILLSQKKFVNNAAEILHFLGRQKNNFSSFAQNNMNTSGSSKFNLPKENIVKAAKALGVIAVVGVIVFGVSKALPNFSSTKGASSQPEVKGATATMSINKEFGFPLTDAKGKEISKIKYLIENAELRDEIIVKGQRATSVKGRTFLIVTLKITNDYEKTVNINSKDYVRLSVNGSEELLAPDIHNDPVEVQAISTKYTRVGFPINTSDKDLILQVGEINGDKERIELAF